MQDIGLVLIVVLILVLLWRGPKTLPKLGQALGRGVREAREEASKAQAEIQSRTSDDDKKPSDEA
jgi:Sec-independent protein translocase protein TatA